MNDDIVELLSELPIGSTVGCIGSSSATVGDITFTEIDCQKLFDSIDTVVALVDALGGPDEAARLNVELIGLEVDDEVLSELEQSFRSVDEI